MKLKSIATLYVASPEWARLSVNSRRIYETGMESLAPLMEMDADKITRPMVIDLRDKLYETPSKCRTAIAVLNNIMRFGYDRGLCQFNHAQNVRNMPKPTPVSRWSDEEIDLFLKHATPPVRYAFLLALYTGQRRGDIIRMRWDLYKDGHIRVRQQKTGRYLSIPVHPELAKVLAEIKSHGPMMQRKRRLEASPYILLSSHGHPWTAVNLSAAVNFVCKKAGIKGKSLHGLRKTTAAKLAEFGCSPHLIASITGHKSLKEVMNYTAEADQVRMANEAMDKWTAAG